MSMSEHLHRALPKHEFVAGRMSLDFCNTLSRTRQDADWDRALTPGDFLEWAQRYGIDEGLVDFGKGEIVPVPGLVEEIIDLVTPDAQFFGCETELLHARTILARGTSAHRQVALYRRAIDDGIEREQALRMVVDQLIVETQTFE